MKLLTACTIATVFLAGCSTSPNRADYAPERNTNPMLLVDEYRIGVDDLVQITVWKNPDLSVTVPVRPDGRISMPLAGEVVAGGKTPEDVAAAITDKLSTYIRDPQVAVILTELRSHEFLSRVRVSGAVNEPSSMPYRQGMTVLDLVLEAGGLNDFAAGNSAKLYRHSSEGMVAIPIELADILNDGEVDTNYAIEPGDILTVPERLF
ncbi:XrtA/PEP-CTERM system exopolysaccharide export protein [Gilvimarinus sp. F26214L]|uniref:XrtA/PEP-CTERM system exopolysaccharide export protein n=1 Tax=Gilvimarinus sp. DZF01 TaxID=3461371 RepID=UPI004045DE4A